MSAHYKPITPLENNDTNAFEPTDEQRYWMKMKEVAVFEEATQNCDFKPAKPFSLASTSGSKMTIYNTKTCHPIASYTRFKAPISYIKYRADGALLGASTQNGFLQFFDVHSEKESRHDKQAPRNPIRTFKSDKCQIGAFDYDLNGRKVVSFADNGCVKLYDLSSDNSKPLWSCKAHTDSVRAGAFSRNSQHYFVTGSYDHKIRYWDIRQKADDSYVIEFDHGYPVERILFFGEENAFFSAGGPVVKMWNLNSGELVKTLKFHTKTVTSLCLASDERYLLTGGFDRRINVVRLDDNEFEQIHSFKVESPVLSLSIDLEDNCMACGTGKKLAIYRRKASHELDERKLKKNKKREKNNKNFKDEFVHDKSGNVTKPEVPVIISKERGGAVEKINLELNERQLDLITLGKNDYLLREGDYRELVSRILLSGKETPEYVVAVFEQIRIRQALGQALSNQGANELHQLFGFLSIHLFEIPFFDILFEVAVKTFEIYARKPFSKKVKKNIKWLERKITTQIAIQKELCQTIGVVQMLCSWSKLDNDTDEKMEVDSLPPMQLHQNGHQSGEIRSSNDDETHSETSTIT